MEAQVTEKAAGEPLDGLRIIELAGIGPGPLCAMLLGDLGAEVIRVDRLGAADAILPLPAAFDVVNRGRRPIALDLKNAAGQETLLRLVEQADALIEGFRPGVTERLRNRPGRVPRPQSQARLSPDNRVWADRAPCPIGRA